MGSKYVFRVRKGTKQQEYRQVSESVHSSWNVRFVEGIIGGVSIKG